MNGQFVLLSLFHCFKIAIITIFLLEKSCRQKSYISEGVSIISNDSLEDVKRFDIFPFSSDYDTIQRINNVAREDLQEKIVIPLVRITFQFYFSFLLS